ncbi:hypothetical protein [Streptomyces sp. NPDC102437]|uniref:hypothetical protein n=1 Tax=Streptomyces sp. NPDC102437 TaxID=3366175 RepID=UPI003814580A
MSRQVLTVCPERPDGFRTIGEALARARNGAVISVRSGTYAESLVITVPVTVVAEQSRGSVEICPPRGSAVVLQAEAVMLTDLVLRGRDEELPVVDAPRGQIAMDGCDITGASWTALLARGSGSVALRDCRVRNPRGAGMVVTDELVTIVRQHASASGYECGAGAGAVMREYFDALPRDRSFGNVRLARQVLEGMMTRQAGRVSTMAAPGLDDLRLLLPEDVVRPQAVPE